MARDTLTPLELSILKRIALEQSANDIARELGISIVDVHNHRKAIMHKTNTRSLIGLFKVAIHHDLLQNYSYKQPSN